MTDREQTPEKLADELHKARQRLLELESHESREQYHLEKALELFERIFSTPHISIAYMDRDFNFIRVNRAYADADEKSPGYFVGKNHFDLYPHEENEKIFRGVVETGQPHVHYAKPFEYAQAPERGVTYWDWTLHPVKHASGEVEGVVLCLVDVTKRIRAEEELIKHQENLEDLVKERTTELQRANVSLQKEIKDRVRFEEALNRELDVNEALSELYEPLTSPTSTIEDIAKIVLDYAKELTASPHGYVSEVDPATRNMLTHTFVEMIKDQCRVSSKDQKVVFPIGEDGRYSRLWGHSLNTLEGFFTNAPEGHPAIGGIPEGHIPITRFLSVPVLLGEELVGQIALANKETDYKPRDLEAIERLGYYYALAIQRKRSQEELQKAHDELEMRVKERTAELLKAKEELTDALSEVKILKNRLEAENIYLQEEIKLEHNFEEIIGQSEKIKRVLGKVEQVASTDATVLILGETGTGKELLARAIHNISPRNRRPLVKVNCAALQQTLIESELFGHEKGAFTGAFTQRAGRFELADNGTMFLDEVGDLSLELQSKLLRVIQEGEMERLGGSHTILVNVRIIAATHRSLEDMMTKGKFREDLYYRLNVFPISIPSLKERREDIPLLVNHFVKKYGRKLGKNIQNIPRKAMGALQSYHWPGNVRELENIVERAVIHTTGPTLHIEEIMMLDPGAPALGDAAYTLEDVERNHILRTLEETNWRIEGKKGAALLLDINPSTLRSRMKKLGIRRPNKP